MRKIILLMHVSLDGLVAGPNGEMDWIGLGDDMWDYVESITDRCDTAIYGGVTFKMMESYWPTAALKPDASRHDINHAKWANDATKIVFSQTIEKTDWQNTRILKVLEPKEIEELKKQPGKDMLMLGSPSLAQSFMKLGLIDEFRLNINPVVIGAGKPLFKDIDTEFKLKLGGVKTLRSGVVALHYLPFSLV